jgi:glycosyltransferase involved in cell wall biosynthesis
MNSSLPRTLFVGRGTGGVNWYRCVLPATVLDADWVGVAGHPPTLNFVAGVASERVTLDSFASYDVVILQQPRGEGWLRTISQLRARGVTVLFEVDDYIHGVRKVDTHELRNIVDRDYVRESELNMGAVDGLICSTEFLARRYRKFNARTWVCPNGIDLKRYAYARPQHDHVTIGWAGTVGHKASMLPWLPAIANVLRARPETRFSTVGAPFADELVGEFGAERCRSLPFAPIEVYPASVSTFDIALAPSGHNNLFRGKSDLRWLEASALGVPVVGDPELYAELEDGVTGLAASTPQEAERALLELVDDAALRRRLGETAHAYVAEHRRIEVAAERWADVLREVAGERAAA